MKTGEFCLKLEKTNKKTINRSRKQKEIKSKHEGELAKEK